MRRSRPGRRFAPLILAVGLASMLAGCGAGAGGASPLVTPLATPLVSVAAPTGEAAGPPEARLAAEGGDPVTGQLGTYTWGDTGSDSPWLPGAPLAVGAGEPLAVAFVPDVAVESWRAVYVPASADGPAGARTLGEGSGPLTFAAPGPGSWTMALDVTFAGGAGSAYYAWRLDIE